MNGSIDRAGAVAWLEKYAMYTTPRAEQRVDETVEEAQHEEHRAEDGEGRRRRQGRAAGFAGGSE